MMRRESPLRFWAPECSQSGHVAETQYEIGVSLRNWRLLERCKVFAVRIEGGVNPGSGVQLYWRTMEGERLEITIDPDGFAHQIPVAWRREHWGNGSALLCTTGFYSRNPSGDPMRGGVGYSLLEPSHTYAYRILLTWHEGKAWSYPFSIHVPPRGSSNGGFYVHAEMSYGAKIEKHRQ